MFHDALSPFSPRHPRPGPAVSTVCNRLYKKQSALIDAHPLHTVVCFASVAQPIRPRIGGIRMLILATFRQSHVLNDEALDHQGVCVCV